MTRRRADLVGAALLALALSACQAAGDEGSSAPLKATLACNEVAQMLEGMPFESVDRGPDTVSDPFTGVERPGCRVTARGRRSRLSVLERTDATSPDARLRELLPPRGWREDMRYAADGPDGTGFAFRGTGVICYFAARWNGGEDVGPEALPPGTYEITAACAESRR